MVGRELLQLLEERHFPISRLSFFSSGTRRQSLRFGGKTHPVTAIDKEVLHASRLVFLVSSDDVSLKLAPSLARRGVWVIDDSAAFRLDSSVPLVIPEVNAQALSLKTRLIAGPNCTMTGLAVAGAALHRAVGVKEVRMASYQAVSGAGKAALDEFLGQARRLVGNFRGPLQRAPLVPALAHKALPGPIAFNVIPQVGKFNVQGDSGEELKVAAELRKVWGAPALRVSVTAVRVPVIRGHCLAAWLTLRRPLALSQARRLIEQTPGVLLSAQGGYPTPLLAAGRNPVFVGRLRQGTGPNEICLWVASDNLLKGAALNSIQIAEHLLKKGWLTPRI